MQELSIKVVGSCVTIDFSDTHLNTETLADRAREVAPLLLSLVSADDTWLKLTEEEQNSRERAYQAMNMMCQAATLNAANRGELLKSISDGKESIADHGFPEFR